MTAFHGVRVGAGVGKVCRLGLRPGIAGYQPSTDNDFGRTAIYRPENIEGQKEKESGSVEIRLKRHLVIESPPIKGIGDSLVVITIAV